MFMQLNAIVIDSDSANRTEMSTFLANGGVTVVAQMSEPSGLAQMLGKPDAAQLVVVNLDPNPHEALKRLGPVVRQFGNISFLVMSQVVDPQLLMDAMHLGVREFVPLPVVPEKFAAGIERVSSIHGMARRARIINVIPTIGGCGSTTVSCNIAASLAGSGRTAIIDLDLVRGAVATSFDLRPRFTIADVVDSGDRVDPHLLENAIAVHGHSSVGVLARPDMPEDTQRVNAPAFGRLLTVLGRMYDHVVIDSLMSIDPVYATALQAADQNILVMQLNVPSAKNAERFLGAMRRMGIDQSKLSIVVNRYVKKGWDIAPEEVEKSLGLKISWAIPNDFKNAIAAINYGEPVVMRVPKAEMSQSLAALAETMSGKRAA